MRMARRFSIGIFGLVGVLLLTGCTDPRELQIQALNDRIDELMRENDGLRSQLAMAIRDRDAARQRAFALHEQNAELRKMLAEGRREAGPAGWVQAGAWSWIDLGTDFMFDSGRATLKPAAKAKLQQVVNQINQHHANKMIWVVGHTDTDPIKKTKNLWKDNLDLSANRAMTVYRELATLGIVPERLIAGGQGEHNPVAPNKTKADKTKNRRVQIVAVPLPGEVDVMEPAPAAATPTAAPPPVVEK